MYLSLRSRLALISTLSVVTVVIAVTGLQIARTHNAAAQAIGASQTALVSAMARAIDHQFEARSSMLDYTASVLSASDMRNATTARQALAIRPGMGAFFESLFLVSADGRILADRPAKPGRTGVDLSDRQYLEELRSTRRPVISDPIRGRVNGQPQVIFGAPIVGPHGEYLGALLGSVNLHESGVTQGLARDRIGKSGYFFLIARKPFPMMVSHPEQARIMQPLELRNAIRDLAMGGWEGTTEGVSTKGVRALYTYKQLRAKDWLIAARLPYDEAFAPIERGQVEMAAIGVALAVLAGLLTWVLISRLLRPLQRLRQEIGLGIREPDYIPVRYSRRRDELGDLSREFSELMRQRATLNAELVESNASLDERVTRKTADLKKQADEMESFLYTLGHDLRSPVRAVSAYSELLLGKLDGKLETPDRRMLERCMDNGRHMGRLIDGMLELGRLARLNVSGTRLVPVDVAEVVNDALKGIVLPAGTRVRINALPPALADEGLLRGAVRALLDNAVKFSARAESPLVEVGGEVRGGRAEYYIRDNGVGFDMAHAASLFKPFSRLHIDEDFPGSGIELAIVARSLKILGGRVWAEGTPGAGACFRFELSVLSEMVCKSGMIPEQVA